MAKKPARNANGRSDPKRNKSLAIRTVLRKMPTAKAADVAAAVKAEFGHTVPVNMVYMVKTKKNMASDGGKKRKATSRGEAMTASKWVEAIKVARQLIQTTGSAANATALLKAIEG